MFAQAAALFEISFSISVPLSDANTHINYIIARP